MPEGLEAAVAASVADAVSGDGVEGGVDADRDDSAKGGELAQPTKRLMKKQSAEICRLLMQQPLFQCLETHPFGASTFFAQTLAFVGFIFLIISIEEYPL